MCRLPAMSADRPAASDGGPMVSHTQQPVGDRVPPPRCTSAFWQVRHGAGDPAAARRFTRPSRPRRRPIVQRRPTVGGGDSPVRRPGADGRCASPVALPLDPPPSRFRRATASYVDRPQAAMGSRHRPGTAPGPASNHPSPLHAPLHGDPTPITQVKVHTRAKSRPGNCDSCPRPVKRLCVSVCYILEYNVPVYNKPDTRAVSLINNSMTIVMFQYFTFKYRRNTPHNIHT